jgi:exosortase O
MLLIVLWMWLFRGIYPYLATIFSQQEFRTNQILLVGVLVLLGLQMSKGQIQPRLTERPTLQLPALALVLASTIGYLLVERFLDINTLSASLFGLATYGLLGLWLSPTRWHQGLPAALLLIGTLPIGEHMETFIGYPLRILSAAVVQEGLSVLGAESISIDTILVFENGISQVDLPCSGVKSLWTGSLFLIAVTWIEQHPINWRWFYAALCFALLLVVANVARVGMLVTVGQVTGWQLFAEMLHVPLGVLAFIIACSAALVLIRWAGKNQQAKLTNPHPVSRMHPDITNHKLLPRPVWLAPVLIIIALVLGLLYKPRPQETIVSAPQTWDFPAVMNVEPWVLSPQEQTWVSGVGDSSATRWRFEWQDLSGSLLFVSSTSWRAQHRPERCFEVFGLSVKDSQSHMIAENFPLRTLSLQNQKDKPIYSAAYWFQSPDYVTDDYGTRMWADLASERQTWVMVTVLFDGPYDPLDQDLLEFYLMLRQTIARNLAGGFHP